jgi:hypothetical protein
MKPADDVALLRLLLSVCPAWKPAPRRAIPAHIRRFLTTASPATLQRLLLDTLDHLRRRK